MILEGKCVCSGKKVSLGASHAGFRLVACRKTSSETAKRKPENPVEILEISYHAIQSESRDDSERRLNKAFDILFEFTMKARDKERSNPHRPV